VPAAEDERVKRVQPDHTHGRKACYLILTDSAGNSERAGVQTVRSDLLLAERIIMESWGETKGTETRTIDVAPRVTRSGARGTTPGPLILEQLRPERRCDMAGRVLFSRRHCAPQSRHCCA
jgi:hypothetical protein